MNNHDAVLAFLAANDGAILGWQLPFHIAAAFSQCVRDGVIRIDDETDCYVHPLAINHGDGLFSMPVSA